MGDIYFDISEEGIKISIKTITIPSSVWTT